MPQNRRRDVQREAGDESAASRHVRLEILLRLCQQAEALRKQFVAAADSDKPRLLTLWKRAAEELTDATLRERRQWAKTSGAAARRPHADYDLA